MEESMYAIGQQDFKSLREGGAVYVDKTAFIERIAKSNIRYYFLARPRRFGRFQLFLQDTLHRRMEDTVILKGIVWKK